MSNDLNLRVCVLYPDLMNIYADRGNTMVLRRRCEDRDIGFEFTAVGINETFNPEAHDLFYIGGGQDSDQKLVAGDMLRTKRDSLAAAADRGAVVLAVCGGYQLLGNSYRLGDDSLQGLGLVEMETVREPGPRLIGNIAIAVTVDGEEHVLAGFENHGGRTYLGKNESPLGEVIDGYGNNGKDGREGVRKNNVIGTYLHGPLLPKNSWFADHLIATALSNACGQPVVLQKLDDELELAAHRRARAAVTSSHRWTGRRRFSLR